MDNENDLEIPYTAPQTNPIDSNMPSVVMPTTREEAIAAGVPEDVFDPEIHLYTESVERSTRPVEVTVLEPQEIENAGPGQ